MEKNDLTATNFLKSKQLRQKYECGICYQVCIKPVRCRGQCSKIFCMKCVSDIRQDVDRCPYKCSSPFLVQRIPDIQLEFFCPYNPTECKLLINSVKSFDLHYKACQYVSHEELYLKQMQQQYKCLKGHQLQFFVGSYEEMLDSACIACQQKKLCRSFCRECDQFYCVTCRIPPCAKEGCPIGHAFSFQRIANLNFICDICGVSTAVSNDGVYDDSLCNFGICEGCYSELPTNFDQSKPRQLIANINSLCSCGNALIFIDTFHEATNCFLCKKMKECPKYCSNCQKHYCLSCKLFDINFDGSCSLDHQLKCCSLVDLGEFAQKQKSFGCMKCGKPKECYNYDNICYVRLCNDCLEYCRKVTSDKLRPIITKCQKNHVLAYVTGPLDWYDTCEICHKQKNIRLKCMCCNQQGVNYCFECKPIRLETCYYYHKLTFQFFQSKRECHFCRKITDQFHYCKRCYFYVCKQCVHENLKQEIVVQENKGRKILKKESGSTAQKMQDCKNQDFLQEI